MDASFVSGTDALHSPPAVFITSIIQLLWETDTFRKRFRPIKHHSNCKYTSCFFCALKSIFPNFQHHKYPGLPPNIVQRAATILQSDSAVSFDSATLALSSLLSSLNTCLSTPLGQELFGIEIDEALACECGYKTKTNSVLRYFLSISVGMFYLQANALRQTERLNTVISPGYFTRIVRESNISLHTLSCPNNTNCSRLIEPSLQLLNSPPLLAFEVAWERGEDNVRDKLDTLLNSLATSLSLDDLFAAPRQSGDKKRYELSAMLCLFESSEVLFTFHSANQSWVRIDSESVKLADGTFPQLLFYMKQNLYLPILLLYSDPDYILPLSSVPVLSQPQLSSSSEESRSHLSNAWRDEEQNTSLWKEGNSSYLQHITDSLQNRTALTDDTHSYGYLDFGLAASEPHAGIINLNKSSPLSSRSDGVLKGQYDNFQPTKVFVHSPSIEKHTIYPDRGEVMSSCSDSVSLSPNPAPLRASSKRNTCQKHVPSIPAPFALLWELEVFRKSLQRVKGHVCTLKTCVFCVYQLILDRFDYKDIPVVPPELLRRVMAICFERQEGYNLGLSFDGIHKTYEELLVRIHYNLTGSEEVTSCSAPHCLTHQKFASNFILHGNCECGHSLEPSHSLELVYSISAQSLIEESRKISNSSKPNRSTLREFETKLKLIGSLQDTQPCPNPTCKAPLRIQRTLTNKPDVFTISLNWDGLHITSQCLHDVINSIGTSIYLDDIFDNTQPFLKFRPFYLTAIVARNDPKYAFFFNHSTLHAWYCLDDAKITTLGDKWSSVNNTLHSLPYQPILLVYIDPLFSQLQTESALTESVLSPGAEGEKIGREFLFPRTPDSVSSCNNVHGSPESMYSSDAELFQWKAGERISYPTSTSGKNICDKLYSQNVDSENELDSSLVIHEELGTFRIVEGADGEKRAFIDLISPTPEISASEENLTTPPALLLLWQLDVFRNILTGITEHQCEGDCCIVCTLKTVQYSTDPNLTPEALKKILSDKSLLEREEQGPQSFYEDVLTRLHKCLCTERNSFTGTADMCCSSLCIAHQKLSLRIEVSERGRHSENNDLFLLELSAPELIRSIRSLNKERSRAAGSIRVMQLFTQATRSLLEQSVGNKKRTLSLLNDPEIICLSLTWNGEPSRDEVAEFYELISTAIQPADLFHHTHNKYIAKRMYYLLGIVTQGPSSNETWFYHQKYRSWTHFSGRTLAVSQLGPQLSLVWHSCKASTNTYAPIFLLYSNPSVQPHSLESICPPATAPKHPSQYNTLTPSKPLFHEDYVVISSERNRVSPFSVQQGVDEALCFLDATIKYEEMNLTPSPLSDHRNPVVSVKSSSLERSGTLDSETLSVISDNNVQASSHSPLLSSLSDRPFSTSIFSPISFEEAAELIDTQESPPLADIMDFAERLSVVVFSLLQINLFRLSLLQIHDDILENTPYLALKQLFHVIIFAPHLISSKFIPIACQHFDFLSNVNGQTSTDLYISFLTHLLSSYPMNPFSNYLRNSMLMQLQHEERTIYTQISLPISANRMVVLLKSSLENARSPLSFDKLFSSLIRQALTCDNTNLTLLNSPDIIPIQMQWNPDVMNSTETEYLIEHISPTLMFKHLFPVVANRTVSNRIFYLYGMIVSINQIQLILFYTNDIKSWIFYDGTNFQVIGYIWQDVLYFLQSNHCRPDLLLYTNPAANLLDATPIQRGLPDISHTKCNNHLNEIAVPILKELLDRNQLENSKSTSCQPSLIHDTVKEVELQCVAGSPIKIVLPNSAGLDNLNMMVNLGSLDQLDIISISSNYESSIQRRVNNSEENGGARKSTPASCSSTSPFRMETRASYHPFFTSLVVLWSIDLFRETLLRQEMILKTPDFIPLIIRIKEVFAACDHTTELTPMLPLFQNLSTGLLKNSQLVGSGTEVFDKILTLMKDELRNSINFQGHDPIGKSRLIQNIFTITLQESGKCRCGATYEPIEIQRNLLHLNLKLYLPHASKACNKYGNINNVSSKLAHKAIRDTLVLMNKRDCKSHSCNRTYLSNSLLVTAPRIFCFALDYEVALTDKTLLLASIPTSLHIDRLFKDIGPNARAGSLLYLTGIMAEISRDRVVHVYYHSTMETWVSVDGMGYKEVGAWSHVVDEITGLDASPISLVYTNPLDMSHHYKDPALVFPVSEVIRTMSAPDPPSNHPNQGDGTRSSDTSDKSKFPHYVTIEDINLNKKRRANQSSSLPDKITPQANRHRVQQSDSSSETVNRGTKPPLPYRQAPSKESTDTSWKSGPRPAFESSEFSSVSDLSAATTKSHLQPILSATSKSDIARPHLDGTKVKTKHKKGSSVTLLNKLNPKTYFKKKDKIRMPRVEQTTRDYPPSSPRLSEILETPKPSRLAPNREESYTDHLNELFSKSPVCEQTVYTSQPRKPDTPFVSDKSLEGKNLGLLESVIQELELKHSPPKLEDEPQPRPRLNLQSNSTPVPRPRELRPHRDPFESSIAVHILLQMINFPSYSHSVLNFSRLPIRKHQIIQALSVLFKRAANNISKADIIEYLNTCMPSMLGNSDFDTGHRLFHQLHWSFQPHSEAFKDHYSLQIRAKDKSASVEDVYFVGTKISDWLVAMEKPLNQKIPVTYNHKIMRNGIWNLFQHLFGQIINSPDQFYVAVSYDIEVDLDLAFRLWNCIPTLLRLGDLCSSLERKYSKHKPFYLTGIIARSASGSLISYSYSENRRLWYSFDPNTHNDDSLNHWEELISYVTRHSIFPIALLYTSPQSQPLFSAPQELATTISHSTQTSLPRNTKQYANSDSSHSQSSSLHKVRYHTLTPHPSVSTTDISRNLPVQLLSTLLLNQGFTASVQSLSNDSCPAIRELRNLILTTFRTFSSRQHSVMIFAEQNLSDVGGESPLDIYQELLSKLVQRNPALRSKLYLSVADRSGEEAIASVRVSLSGYMSQVAHIPQFSKLNPKKCKIALKPASSIGKKQIQNATNLISLYVGEDNSNGETIFFLPSLLRLSYLGSVNPNCYVHHVSYYLTGLILKTKDNTYTSAVFLAPRNHWLLLEMNSLSEGQELTWAELCESLHSSPLSPVFCFYSNSNIMGQYSVYLPSLSVTSSHSHPATLSSAASQSMVQPDNQEELPFMTSPSSHLIDLSFTQPEDNFFDFLSDDLAPTTSLTNTNPPPEIYQPSFQSVITYDREDSPLLTFPPPPDKSPSPTIYILTPEQTSTNHTDFQLDIPTSQLSGNELDQSFHLFNSAVTMLWHIPFFRHSVLLAPGHTCVGFSCALCALKSLFALYYYSRSYALSSDAIYLAKKHGFVSTENYQSIGEMLPAMVKQIDNTLKSGNYRLMNNFILKHDQGILTVLPVSMPLLCENMMKLAITKKFSREDHPLLFSKALSATLQFRQQLLSSPNVLILDFREESELQHACFLGSYINLSDLVITKKRNNCYTTHFYLSSVLTSDGTGGHSTFSFHSDLKLWIGYDGHNAIQFTTFANLTSYLINKRLTLLSCLYVNPSTYRPSPQDLPLQIVRAPEAVGESATIRRMQQVEEESTQNKSSLYPSIPVGIGFQNLLENYERNKQGVGKLTTPPNLSASAPFLPPSQQFVIPAQVSSLALPPSINPNHPYQFQAGPSYPDGSSFPATHDPHSLMTPPVNLAYPPFIFPSLTPQPCLQYPPPLHNVPPQKEVQSTSTSFPKFSFTPFPHSGKALSSQAVTKLSDKLTETGQWAHLYQSIPCIGESYEIKAFQQRQKQTNFSPGRAVLERIHDYQIPIEVLLQAFTQTDFQEGIDLLMDVSSYSTENLSVSSLSSSLNTPDESSSEDEDYNPDINSIRAELSTETEIIPVENSTSETVEDLGNDELIGEERDLLHRKHSEEEAFLLRDYQEKMEAQELRQKREMESLSSKQFQNISEFHDLNLENDSPQEMTDVPQYISPPSLTNGASLQIPAFPASFPPTKADMFYTQARDLYRETLNISDFSVAFSLCVQAQNKLDLALIEPDVRLDPVKKQAYSQLRHICHQQAVRLHRRSVLRTLDPNHQFKSPAKKLSNAKTKRVKFDTAIDDNQENSPPPEEQPQALPLYIRPILRPPPLTPSLYQSIPRPPPIGRAMRDEDKENTKPPHRVDYPPSRKQQAPPVTESPPCIESPPSTPSTFSTISDDMTSSSSSRASSRSRKHEQRRDRDLPPTRPFFNDDHYTILDQFIRHRRDNIPPAMDHSELSRKLLDSKINSRSISLSTNTVSPARDEQKDTTPPSRDYFKLSSVSDGTSEGVVPRIPIDGTHLVPEKCSVCRSDKFFTIKTMCPDCYTRYIRSTDLMLRSGADPTEV